ncbi:hypothetical protein FDG2_6347 [Candidatus Protofrankia californiensis]|uniref:Uncharacterized protein n=1 Tax=Candidatus Protofrankia californiensis TaxID=1839754 RepID=A0A1C3PGR2_9ACTN|nr:hypothetical protein FDG2_6347 [Candidatus Protofrankia californiensis]
MIMFLALPEAWAPGGSGLPLADRWRLLGRPLLLDRRG